MPIPALICRVQRLVNVPHEVNGIAQCIPLEVVGRRAAQSRLQPLPLSDDAIALL
jgi:hypothetical protein